MRLTRPFFPFAAGALAFSGRTVTPENAFPEARTVGECQGQYQVAQRTTRQAVSNSRSSSPELGLLGAVLLGVAGGASQSNDNTKLLVCLERVGASEEEMRAAVRGQSVSSSSQRGTAATAQNARKAIVPAVSNCAAGSSVMQGGTGYCVGR